VATSSLTERQRVSLFAILEVPYAAQSHRVVGDGINAVANLVQIGADEARQTILTYLDDPVAETPALETELKAYLDRFYALGTSCTRMEAGNVGSLGGIYHDPAAEREEIRRRVLGIVPFWRSHLEMQHKARGNAAGTVPFVH
jgi:hypothetical protein